MAEICFGVVSDNDSNPAACEPSSRAARRRRMEIKQFKFVALSENDTDDEELKLPINPADSVARTAVDNGFAEPESRRPETKKDTFDSAPLSSNLTTGNSSLTQLPNSKKHPRFGVATVCGRRRDMEDAIAIRPSFLSPADDLAGDLHYFAVYDGHGCSHVALRCSERLHELVREELRKEEDEEEASTEWRKAMERSFSRMDEEVRASNNQVTDVVAKCRCELQSPESDAVGSTAVVAILTPDKIVVANCGDSRAVLCRSGKALPLSSDHKPDRPDELNRIQEAGGRVIYWDGARVLGVLAMSRAIGDNYLKPYVSCEPEVMIVDRTAEDECLILGTDGLWDVVSNDTACGVARMCLRGKLHTRRGEAAAAAAAAAVASASASASGSTSSSTSKQPAMLGADKACSDASLLLTKLALARHSSDNVSIVVVDLSRRDT